MSHNPDRSNFDQRIADWLEDHPNQAPDSVLGTVLAAAPLIKQRRANRVPWRSNPMSRLSLIGAAAALLVVVGLGGWFLANRPSGQAAASPAPTTLPSATPGSTPGSTPAVTGTPSASAPPSAPADASNLAGKILVEHLGNAIDGSEMPTTDYHPDRRRLYWMQPSTMTGDTAVEFLPGKPSTGKLNADVSRDGTKVVFMDTATPARIWLANADGSGLRVLSTACSCSELDPAFDPTGTKVVFVHLEGATRNSQFGANLAVDVPSAKAKSWLAIRDLATGTVTKLAATAATGSDGLPYQPAWSPDGTEIAFNRTTWPDYDPPTGSLQVVTVATGTVRTLATPDATDPGDVDWSPDGTTLVFTNHPWSEMGSIVDIPPAATYTIDRAGTNLRLLNSGAGASYLPDGRILFQNNVLYVMSGTGTDVLPVNANASDLTELAVGFVYISHFVATP